MTILRSIAQIHLAEQGSLNQRSFDVVVDLLNIRHVGGENLFPTGFQPAEA
jgi:hypothetical protein